MELKQFLWKVTILLIWVWSRDSCSQWGPVLLVQCEVYWVKADVRSRRGVKGRERKRQFAQSTSRKFSPSSAFSHTLSLLHNVSVCLCLLCFVCCFHILCFPLFFLTNVTFHSLLNPSPLCFPTACFCNTIRLNQTETNTPVMIFYITLASLLMFSSSWNWVQVVQIYTDTFYSLIFS